MCLQTAVSDQHGLVWLRWEPLICLVQSLMQAQASSHSLSRCRGFTPGHTVTAGLPAVGLDGRQDGGGCHAAHDAQAPPCPVVRHNAGTALCSGNRAGAGAGARPSSAQDVCWLLHAPQCLTAGALRAQPLSHGENAKRLSMQRMPPAEQPWCQGAANRCNRIGTCHVTCWSLPHLEAAWCSAEVDQLRRLSKLACGLQQSHSA